MSSDRIKGDGRIHVSGLPLDVTEDDLLSLFDKFGSIKRIDLKYGYAYLFYESGENANAAVDEMKGYEFKGKNIKVETAFTDRVPPAKAPPVIRQEFRLRILDIDSDCIWKDLKDWGRVVGPVHYTATHTLQGVPLGIIEYENEEDVEKALEMLPNEPLKGRNVKVVRDDPNDGPFDPPVVNPKFGGGRGGRFDNRGGRFDRPRDFDRNTQYRRGNDDYDNRRRDSFDDRSRDFGRNQYNDSYDNRRRDSYDNRGRDSYDNRGRDSYDNRGRDSYDNRGRDSYDNRGRDNYDNRGRENHDRPRDFGFDNRGRDNNYGRGRDDGPRRPNDYNFDRPRSRSRDRNLDNRRGGGFGR